MSRIDYDERAAAAFEACRELPYSGLTAAARELARVLRPGAPVLIRSAFAGRCQHIGLTRFWPETAAVLDTFPSVAEVRTAPPPPTPSPSPTAWTCSYRTTRHPNRR